MKRVILPLLTIALFVLGASFQSDRFEVSKQLEIFTDIYYKIDKNYVDETNPADLMDSAIKGMLKKLDPYTIYWSEQDVEAARIRNAGEYTGIGAIVRTIKDKILIIEPHKGYPADKAGLKAGDEIIQIGDTKVADFTDDAGELLKGAAGTKIKLVYKRQNEIKRTTLTREAIEVNAVPFYTLLDDKSGYIVLSKFNKKASEQTIAALLDLKSKGANKIILDLRNNPGGLLTEAIAVTNIFVPKQTLITETKSVVKKYNKPYFTRQDPIDTEIPLVVLVNGRSASASEIVAGGVQDLDRGVVIGARSFGKGLVQRPKDIEHGTKLKVTISRYHTPSGRCIQSLDYWNRDENDDAVKIKETDYQAFKTKNGRTVYDGGGIQPDIEIASAKNSPITKTLMKEYTIFNYATEYYNNNDVQDLNSFSFTDSDYDAFKKYLKNGNFSYETQTELLLKKTMRTAEKETFDDDIDASYKALLKNIKNAKEKELNHKKDEISHLLTNEIIKRYFYSEGLYKYYVQHDPAVLKSKEILGNAAKYNDILH